MKMVGFSTSFIWLIILSLVFSIFVSVKTSQCPTEPLMLSSAGICAGETLTSPTLWSVIHSPLIIETKFLLLILVAFTLLPHLKWIFVQKAPRKGITRQTHTLIRSGPVPRGVFVPYLFATHDW
ncbi:TPA: hypothetical protein DCW61_00205 [Candidatus Uhrbacteria bacterium]|nr:hypothetical protein [Candidatus Uhrbacteria bacterium]